MLVEYFKQYMKITRGVSDSTIKHYITGINTINKLLNDCGFPIKNIFETETLSELESIKVFLNNSEEFLTKDRAGNRMYSSAFNNFYRFACEDMSFYKTDIEKMDIKIPKLTVVTAKQYQRNQIISSHATEAANYQCENDHKHITFTSAKSNKPYMEAHHLIPLKEQGKFNVSLDVYANIICLCPICHRLLHYGITAEKEYVADKLFDYRKERLIHSGIDINRNEFNQLLGM